MLAMGGGTFQSKPVTDIMTGYRALSPLFVKSFPILSQGFEIETEMTAHAFDKNFAVASVAVDYKDRPQGSFSKLNTLQDGFKVLRTIMRLFKNYRPLLFFNLAAVALWVIALPFFISVLLEFYDTGLVERFPTFIACCFTFVMGLLFSFCGVLLDVMGQKSRQSFEVTLNELAMYLKGSKLRGVMTKGPATESEHGSQPQRDPCSDLTGCQEPKKGSKSKDDSLTGEGK